MIVGSDSTSRRAHALAALLATLLPSAAALAQAAPPPAEAPEATAAGKLFGARCTSCHTLGEGPKVGPDLLGVTDRRSPEWLRKFLQSPGAMIDSGDATAAQLVKAANGVRMPEQNLAQPDIAGLLAFFKACTGKKGCQPIGAPKLAIDATAAEVEQGRALFSGELKLQRGGPACAECHHARGVGMLGGGTLGGDLTFTWARLHDAGLAEAIGASPIEKMVYAQKELTDAERFALRGYLASLCKDGARELRGNDFFDIGLLSALAALGAVGIAWVSRSGSGRA
jgi:cytochrome c2